MKKKGYNRLDKILELPQEVCSNTPKISITGFNEMIIENFKGILEYEEFFVRINTYIGIISVNGFNLNLENMTNDDIKVTRTNWKYWLWKNSRLRRKNNDYQNIT